MKLGYWRFGRIYSIQRKREGYKTAKAGRFLVPSSLCGLVRINFLFSSQAPLNINGKNYAINFFILSTSSVEWNGFVM